jgi:hypothetical protein
MVRQDSLNTTLRDLAERFPAGLLRHFVAQCAFVAVSYGASLLRLDSDPIYEFGKARKVLLDARALFVADAGGNPGGKRTHLIDLQ